MKNRKLYPKLSTKKIKLILSGKIKKPNLRAAMMAMTIASYAFRAAMINATPCFNAFQKASKALELVELSLDFAQSIKQLSNKKN